MSAPTAATLLNHLEKAFGEFKAGDAAANSGYAGWLLNYARYRRFCELGDGERACILEAMQALLDPPAGTRALRNVGAVVAFEHVCAAIEMLQDERAGCLGPCWEPEHESQP